MGLFLGTFRVREIACGKVDGMSRETKGVETFLKERFGKRGAKRYTLDNFGICMKECVHMLCATFIRTTT